jgi:hopanoid biosynthesis associated RND transporter like protein HpnN
MRHALLDRLAGAICAAPGRVVLALLAAAALAGAWSADRVRMDANTDSLMGDDQAYVRAYKGFLREFGDLEYAWVVVDATGPDGARHLGEAQRAVDLLDARLRASPHVDRVCSRVTAPEQVRLATWAMPDADLRGLAEARDALPLLAADAGAGTVLADAGRRLERLGVGALFMPRAEAEREGAAAVLELEAVAAAAPGAGPSLGAPREDRYLESDSGRLLFVAVMPRKDFSRFEVIDEPLAEIRAAIAEVQVRVPDVAIGLTGKPVLQADEMATTNVDMNLSSVVGLVLCVGLFMAVFRGVRLPLLALVPFLAASALTYASAALIYGRLNLLSIVFMLVLVGVGLDYGIHMVARYVEARRHLPVREAVVHMMRTAVPSNLSGALTSAGVFLLAWFTEFQGLRELGTVSGVGILLALVTMVVGLPALLMLFDGRLARGADRPAPRAPAFLTQREGVDRAIRAGRARVTVAASLLAAGASAWYGLTHLTFESNLLKLQAKGLDSVRWEHRVMEDSAAASWFGACVVPRIEDIEPLVGRLRAHPEVGKVRSVLDAVVPDTPERVALRTQVANAVEAAPVRPRRVEAWDAASVRACAGRVEDLAGHAEREAPEAAGRLRALAARLRTVADLCDPAHHPAPDVAVARAAVEESVTRTAVALRQVSAGARCSMREALPEAVREQMISPGGRYLVMVHPAGDVWESGPLARFVDVLRAEDPAATGVPMTVSESMRSMRRSFAQQAVLASLLVLALLWIDLRNVRETAAAALSLMVGIAWTLGAMALLGSGFNLANFFAIPILIGLGIDSAIHVTHRAHEGALEHGFGSTRRAVAVTALTTTIGFGALVLAHHQGLRSLGIAMAVGSLCCLLSAVWTLPALLRVIGLRPTRTHLRLVGGTGGARDAA